MAAVEGCVCVRRPRLGGIAKLGSGFSPGAILLIWMLGLASAAPPAQIQPGGIAVGEASCAKEVNVIPNTTTYDQAKVKCLRDLIDNCTSSSFTVYNNFGWVDVDISGVSNAQCSLAASHDFEQAKSYYSCTVPLAQMRAWTGWTHPNGYDVLKGIESYCTKGVPTLWVTVIAVLGIVGVITAISYLVIKKRRILRGVV